MTRERGLSIVLVVPLFLLLWLLYGGNYWNGDRDAYELYYERESLAAWGLEFGYGYLNLVSQGLRLEFQTFQVFVSLVTILLYLRYFFKSSYSPALSFLLYTVLFFPLDYVLMRNSLAFAVSLQAFVLLYENAKNSKIKFVSLILLAASLHQSAFFFLIFYFMPLCKVMILRRFLPLFIAGVLSYALLRLRVSLPDSIQAHFDVYKVSFKSSSLNLAFHFFSVSLMFFSVASEKRSIFNRIARTVRERELVFILNLNLMSCFWVVLYFESEIFVRLLRFLVFFNVFFLLSSMTLRLKSNWFNLFAIFIFSFYLVFYYIFPVIGLAVLPLFNKNVLLRFFM